MLNKISLLQKYICSFSILSIDAKIPLYSKSVAKERTKLFSQRTDNMFLMPIFTGLDIFNFLFSKDSSVLQSFYVETKRALCRSFVEGAEVWEDESLEKKTNRSTHIA